MNIETGYMSVFNWLAAEPKSQGTLGAWLTNAAKKGGDALAREHGDFMSMPLSRGARGVERAVTSASALATCFEIVSLAIAAPGLAAAVIPLAPLLVVGLVVSKALGVAFGVAANTGLDKMADGVADRQWTQKHRKKPGADRNGHASAQPAR